MEVNCEILDQHTTEATGSIADRTISNHGAGNFRSKIEEHLNGNTVLLDDDMEMLVIGGRHSICRAFATPPVISYVFAAPPGKVIYASRAASSRKRWAFGMGAARVGQMLTGPAYNLVPTGVAAARDPSPMSAGRNYARFMENTYSPKVNGAFAGVLNEAAKTRTVLHLFSESANFGGHVLGNRLTGADVALQLSMFFW